jgi:hypothetical protein
MTSAVKWRHDKSQMVHIVDVQRHRRATDTRTHFASRLKPRPVARRRETQIHFIRRSTTSALSRSFSDARRTRSIGVLAHRERDSTMAVWAKVTAHT